MFVNVIKTIFMSTNKITNSLLGQRSFKKFITVYSLDIYFRYYYNIKQHIYKINNYPDIYNKTNLYSNHYSFMFYILFIFDI